MNDEFATTLARLDLAIARHRTLVEMWNEDYDYRLANGLDLEATGEGLEW